MTIGAYDGVHLGHRAVIGEVRRRAEAQGLRTAVVTFGRPSILEEAGMHSPYPLIWSLPMRVEDPRLHRLTPLLRRQRPEWVLVDPVAMDSWGMGDLRAERVLARHYRPAFRSGDLVVWRAVRPHVPWHASTV